MHIGTLGEKAIQTESVIYSHSNVNEGYQSHCTGQAGHGRGHFLGKDDSFDSTLSIIYLSMTGRQYGGHICRERLVHHLSGN